MYELLDPEIKDRRFDSNVFVLHLLLCVEVFLCVSFLDYMCFKYCTTVLHQGGCK